MAAKRYRKERVADAIKKVLSNVIRAEIRNPDIPLFTTVTDVEVSSDLAYATVYISIPGTDSEKKKALQALQKSKGFLRTRVASEIQIMHTPELNIKEDTSLEYAMNIEKKLDEVMGRNRVNNQLREAQSDEIFDDNFDDNFDESLNDD